VAADGPPDRYRLEVPTAATLALFAGAALLLLVIPGPSVLYIVTRSATQGRQAGFASVLGVHTGTLVHVTAAALGLSALLVASATAFTVVKIGGGAYLVYLGVRRLLDHSSADATVSSAPGRSSLRRIYTQGVVVNVLNPKTALFFLAFLPQFLDRDRGPIPLQVAVLGAEFVLLGFISDGIYALLAGTIAARLRGGITDSPWIRRATGSIFIGLGLTAAFTGSPAKTTT
jgi:threonine/homoserine/homoserine lactone efflux protein